ncbi:MAG TPA: EamA family transporter [Gaiellaceae bacterium]
MVAIIGGLGAAIAWATTTLVAARATRLIDVRSLLATVMAVGLVISAPAAAIAGVPHGLAGSTWAWLALSGLANIAGLLCAYSALRIGKVGMVAPITSTEGAVAAVIAVIAGESLSGGTGVMLGVVALGVMLAARAPSSDDGGRRTDLRAALFAGGAALSFGVGLYSTGRVGQSLGVAWAALPPRVVGVLVIALPLALSRRWRMTRAALPYAIVGGIFEVLGFVSYAFGARHGLAVAAVLSSQFAGIAAIVGYIVFRERLARIQVAGVATIVVGVSVLSALHS